MQQHQATNSSLPCDEFATGQWKRNSKKELGFFPLCDQLIPRHIFGAIIEFIPAFPYYFVIRSVCSQWLYEFEEKIYGQVHYLDLVNDGKPKFYVVPQQHTSGDDVQMDGKEGNNVKIVRYKPIDMTGKHCDISTLTELGVETQRDNRVSIYHFLSNVFHNVRHLRLAFSTYSSLEMFDCLKTMLPRLTKLERLDIIGALSNNHWGGATAHLVVERLCNLVAHLPSWLKSLHLIGIKLEYVEDTFLVLQSLTDRGRNISGVIQYEYTGRMIEANINELHLNHCFFERNYSVDCRRVIKELHQVIPSLNILESLDCNAISSHTDFPSVSYADYIRYMTEREGIVLSYLAQYDLGMKRDDVIDAIVDAAVSEYPYFKSVIDRSMAERDWQLRPRTPPDLSLIMLHPRATSYFLSVLTDIERMKYPELVFDVNHAYPYFGITGAGVTVLTFLIQNCESEDALEAIKTVVTQYGALLAVDSVRNYLLDAYSLPDTEIRSELVEYLLMKKPDLVLLGDSSGVIRCDQKQLPILHLMIKYCFANPQENLVNFQYLVRRGASLSNLSSQGDNYLHLSCQLLDTNYLEFFLANGSMDDLFVKNDHNQTPLEMAFLESASTYMHTSHSSPGQFLESIDKLSVLKQGKECIFKEYETSCGTLLHAAVKNSFYQDSSIGFLLKKGVDANALNTHGENVLFSFQNQTPAFLDTLSAARFQKRVNQLINAGAQVDCLNNEGTSVIMKALEQENYPLIEAIIQKLSDDNIAELLKERKRNGVNALHFTIPLLTNIVEKLSSMNRNQEVLCEGNYPIALRCAKLCIKYHPEMFNEREHVDGGVDQTTPSPLEILLSSSHGHFLLSDLAIDLSELANKPIVLPDKQIAQLPAVFVALSKTGSPVLFDKILSHTTDVMAYDNSDVHKSNLLQITARNNFSMCQSVLKYWKKNYSKKELCDLISKPLENDDVNERRPRNSITLSCIEGQFEVFSILWPYVHSNAKLLDNPVEVAMDHNQYDFALNCMIQHGILPSSKSRMQSIIRYHLFNQKLNRTYDLKVVDWLECLREESEGSWIDILCATPAQLSQKENENMSTFKLLLVNAFSNTLGWFFKHFMHHSKFSDVILSFDVQTGETLLHLLTGELFPRSEYESCHEILNLILQYFDSLDDSEKVSSFVNHRNQLGQTCLHHIVTNIDIHSMIPTLVRYGADITITDKEGHTPLDNASESIKKHHETNEDSK